MSEQPWKVKTLLAGNWRGATSVLISNGRQHVVVDTGMAHEAHLLLEALARHGLEASHVHSLINTHFHIDHVLNNALFPNSLIYASQESYDWCCSLYSDMAEDQWETLLLKYYPEMSGYQRVLDRMHQMRRFTLRWWDLDRLGKRSQLRWIEQNALPDGFDTLITSGHVPGHVSVILPDGPRPTIVAGDAFLSRAEDDRILTMIPHNREQARRDREQILARGGRIFPGHDAEFMNDTKLA
ncbi:MAG TPA: MBL fold metallo-hydrolase [Terriglobia bacterium]|nr:MBL fold metallo-hydrolase [Terriglobia bacterium]